MNRGYNNLTGNRFAPNSFPAQQPMPYNMNYYPNNMHQMPPPNPLLHQQRGGHYRLNPYNQPPQGPMMSHGQNFNEAPPQEKKGLLSKLFRNSNKQQSAPTAQSLFSLPPNSSRGAGAAAAATTATSGGGGVLQSLVNPANITTMLNNTQRVLQAAESIGPLVQQYGPLVKNIPSMWKLYQGLKTTDTDEQNNNNQNNTTNEPMAPIKPNVTESTIHANNPIKDPNVHINPLSPDERKPFRQYAKGESIPRLFI